MYENTITSPDETSLSEKFPLKSVFVPLVVFFTTTLTPGSASFELASVTYSILLFEIQSISFLVLL